MWDPPVLIPNTEVKPHRADGTVRDTVWESRTLPHFIEKADEDHLSFLFARISLLTLPLTFTFSFIFPLRALFFPTVFVYIFYVFCASGNVRASLPVIKFFRSNSPPDGEIKRKAAEYERGRAYKKQDSRNEANPKSWTDFWRCIFSCQKEKDFKQSTRQSLSYLL